MLLFFIVLYFQLSSLHRPHHDSLSLSFTTMYEPSSPTTGWVITEFLPPSRPGRCFPPALLRKCPMHGQLLICALTIHLDCIILNLYLPGICFLTPGGCSFWLNAWLTLSHREQAHEDVWVAVFRSYFGWHGSHTSYLMIHYAPPNSPKHLQTNTIRPIDHFWVSVI